MIELKFPEGITIKNGETLTVEWDPDTMTVRRCIITPARKEPFVLEGNIQKDRLGWTTFVKVGGRFVKHWIWDSLAKFEEGKRLRITIEEIDDPS